MNKLERALLQETIGDEEPSLCLRTKLRVDAGLWGRKAPLWLCIVNDQLVLLAVAKRRYSQSVPLSECVDSIYCSAAGELVIKPVENLEFDRVRMSPADALKVLAEISDRVGDLRPQSGVKIPSVAEAMGGEQEPSVGVGM